MELIIIFGSFILSFLWFGEKQETIDFFQRMSEVDFDTMIHRLDNKDRNRSIMERWALTICFSILGSTIGIGSFTATFSFGALGGIIGYKGYYYFIKRQYRKALNVAVKNFPFFLNRLCILIQTNPVPVALAQSIEEAPIVFRKELVILVKDIHEGKKESITPYLEFANKFYQIPDCARIFRSLHALSISVSQKEKTLLSLSKLTNIKLTLERSKRLDQFLDQQALIPWILFLWIGLLIIALFSTISLGGMI